MVDELSQDAEREIAKLQLDAYLAEYKTARDIVERSRVMQGQLDNLALVALGVSIPLVLVIVDRGPTAIGAVLLIPILFFAIVFAQLRHERILYIYATYVDAELKPKINDLLSAVSKSKVLVFESERFLVQRSWAPTLFLQWAATVSRGIIGLTIGLAVVILYLYLRLLLFKSGLYSYEIWLLIINSLILIGNLIIAFFIARIRYADRKERYWASS